MYLQNITIDNFACFKHFDASLARQANVIIGRNGSGKTTLIRAIVYALNFIFTNDRLMGNDYLSAGNPDLKMSSVPMSDIYRDVTSSVAPYVNFHGLMDFDGDLLEWDMYKKSVPGSSLYPSKYVNAYRKFMDVTKKNGYLPVLAYFSDSFPHKLTNISSFAKNEINNTEGILNNFGYYQWNNETSCTTIWQLRLLNVLAKDLSLNDPSSFVHKEVEYITSKLMAFSRTIEEEADDSFEIQKVFFSFQNGEKPELWLKLKYGAEIPFNSLPAGYLRLYSMALDIAYRSFLLNKTNQSKIGGIVIIDEIDLHLHPSLALEVLQRFMLTFPKIQFIVSTHSPLVISNLKPNNDCQIMKLVMQQDRPVAIPNIYGIDYNSSLSDIMGVSATNEEIEFLFHSIIRSRRRGKNTQADDKMEELRKLVSSERFEKIKKEIEASLNEQP